VQPALEMSPDDQKHEGNRKGDRDDPPLPDPAGNADASRKPGTGGTGQPVNLGFVLVPDDDAGSAPMRRRIGD